MSADTDVFVQQKSTSGVRPVMHAQVQSTQRGVKHSQYIQASLSPCNPERRISVYPTVKKMHATGGPYSAYLCAYVLQHATKAWHTPLLFPEVVTQHVHMTQLYIYTNVCTWSTIMVLLFNVIMHISCVFACKAFLEDYNPLYSEGQ